MLFLLERIVWVFSPILLMSHFTLAGLHPDPPLHPTDKSHLTVVGDPVQMLLKSAC